MSRATNGKSLEYLGQLESALGENSDLNKFIMDLQGEIANQKLQINEMEQLLHARS